MGHTKLGRLRLPNLPCFRQVKFRTIPTEELLRVQIVIPLWDAQYDARNRNSPLAALSGKIISDYCNEQLDIEAWLLRRRGRYDGGHEKGGDRPLVLCVQRSPSELA